MLRFYVALSGKVKNNIFKNGIFVNSFQYKCFLFICVFFAFFVEQLSHEKPQSRRKEFKEVSYLLFEPIAIIGYLEFGIWNLEFGIWDLGFGIWDLGFGI
jgi:hypothetical protein